MNAESQNRDQLREFWLGLTGRDSINHTSFKILASFTNEYGMQTVCDWLQIAWNKTSSKDDESLGKYVCGIRRKLKEQGPAPRHAPLIVQQYVEDPDFLRPEYLTLRNWRGNDFSGAAKYLQQFEGISFKLIDESTFVLGSIYDGLHYDTWPIKALRANELFYGRHWSYYRRDEIHVFEKDAYLKYPRPGLDPEFKH